MAVPPTLSPDPVAAQLASAVAAGDTAVTFRGWLHTGTGGAPLSDDTYRLFTSPWGDEWLEIKSADLLYQQPGAAGGAAAAAAGGGSNDRSSIIWVRRDAVIAKCHAAEACHFAEEEAELGADPTAANPVAAKYPRI